MRIEPQKILCAIDFSEGSRGILSYGSLLAEEFGSKLTLCHIVPANLNVSAHLTTYFDYSGIEQELMEKAQHRLGKMAETLDVACDVLVASGHPAMQIESIAHEQKMDMVIAATHGRSGMKRFLIGSVTERLLKVLNCPLLVLHGRDDSIPEKSMPAAQIKKILVGCDFSRDSDLAMKYAVSFAQEFQTQLHLAHVIRPEERADVLFQVEAGAQETSSGTWDRLVYPGVEFDPSSENARLKEMLAALVPPGSSDWCLPVTVLLDGQPYKELVSYAVGEQIDLIVLGVRGHNLLEEFLVGSTTDRVIRQARCPVLAVRHHQED